MEKIKYYNHDGYDDQNHVIIPLDWLIEILLKLPVKSLLKFQCLSKYFGTIINSQEFITNHFLHRKSEALLIHHHYMKTTIEKAGFTLFNTENCCVPHNLHDHQSPLLENLGHLQMSTVLHKGFGPINGLLLFFRISGLLKSKMCLALCNPATREFKNLPILGLDLPPYLVPLDFSIGFGLDPITNDYKVICVRYIVDRETEDPYGPPLASVYTLASNSWRHIPSMWDDSRFILHDSNVYLNGCCYWHGKKDIDLMFKVVSFDMGTEVFRVIPGPPVSVEGTYDKSLVKYNDYLAFVCEVGLYINLWLMKEEGYWMRHVKVNIRASDRHIKGPLGFWRDNELVLETYITGELFVYNLNTGEFQNLGTLGRFGYHRPIMFNYKESLVSPTRLGNQWRQNMENFRKSLHYFCEC